MAAKDTEEAVSLTVGTAAFEGRYRKAIAEWKLVCDISDSDIAQKAIAEWKLVCDISDCDCRDGECKVE